MIKISVLGLVAAAVLSTSVSTFAEDKAGDACCTKNVANATGKPLCTDLALLGVNDEQKAKLEAWQAECMKAGCTRDARHKFFQQAKGILSAEQFAKLKSECKKNKEGSTT